MRDDTTLQLVSLSLNVSESHLKDPTGRSFFLVAAHGLRFRLVGGCKQRASLAGLCAFLFFW